MSGLTRLSRPPSRGGPGPWLKPFVWTALAFGCLNLLVAYLLARAVWGGRVPPVETIWVLALSAITVVLVALAAGGWIRYLRGRRRSS